MDLTLFELGTRMKPASHKPTASTTGNGINHLYEKTTLQASGQSQEILSTVDKPRGLSVPMKLAGMNE